ncbi:hypothetical protein FACS1894137_18370 [Spirochaetia bacterium]|nr:hypothetical protein FACS1894137_18370 [Spirochaetia bacterium]
MVLGIISLFLANGIYLLNSHVPYAYFSPIPSLILNNIPQIYNPYPYTFITRTQHIDGEHIDGNYWVLHEKPYFYFDNNDYIRKILITKESSYELINLIDQGKLVEDTSDIEKLREKIALSKYNRYMNTDYINLGRDINILNIE